MELRLHLLWKILLWALPFLALILLLAWTCSLKLSVSVYSISSAKVTAPIRIALITDLHGCVYGQDQADLLAALAEQDPDLICISGDLIDENKSPEGAWMLLAAVGRAYPCFYVSGNHEFRTENLEELRSTIASYGVTLLAGEAVSCMINDQPLSIAGVDDPTGVGPIAWQEQVEQAQSQIGTGYTILLSHRPERIQAYQGSRFDLVLSGHAHGGQVRLPGLVNGLYAPGQGWFPQYAGGLYPLGETNLVVSRGLCKGLLPRVFNRPELVMVEIQPAS